MLPASASIQGPLSIGFPHKSFRSTFKIYERELVIACPILLLFAHHCGSSAERSPTVRLLASRKLSILTQAWASQKSGVRPTERPRQLSWHAKNARLFLGTDPRCSSGAFALSRHRASLQP